MGVLNSEVSHMLTGPTSNSEFISSSFRQIALLFGMLKSSRIRTQVEVRAYTSLTKYTIQSHAISRFQVLELRAGFPSTSTFTSLLLKSATRGKVIPRLTSTLCTSEVPTSKDHVFAPSE